MHRHHRHTRSLAAVRRAQRLLEPGKSVVLDTETTDLAGEIVEIAIIDATTGDVLVDTLVKPSCPISPEATAVHGITNDMVAAAPSWQDVWPTVRDALQGRHVIAYNATFDAAQLRAECHRTNLDAPWLHWSCAMRIDAAAGNRRRWRRLNGGHRALGDAIAARNVLVAAAHRTLTLGGHR